MIGWVPTIQVSRYHSRRSGGNFGLGQSEVSEEKMEATFLQYMDWVFWQQIYMRKYMENMVNLRCKPCTEK